MEDAKTGGGTVVSVLGIEEFRSVLRRERDLADRSGLSFAVIRFQLRPESRTGGLGRLLAVVRERTRETDVVGLFAREELAVLLRYSSAADAVRVAAEIREHVTGAPLCTVYGHPPFEAGSVSAPKEAPASVTVDDVLAPVAGARTNASEEVEAQQVVSQGTNGGVP